MALGSTQNVFDIALSDMDRGVYEALSLKVACHPSESAAYMLTRVLAYALELREGIAFSQGLSVADEPALWVRDLTGQLVAWIEVGTPNAARLHKATKACEEVVVYCHKDVVGYLRGLAGERIYEAGRVRIVEVERSFVEAVAPLLGRRNALTITLTEGQLYLDVEGASFSTELKVHRLQGADQ